MDIETGNAYDQDTEGTGWFLGFGAWTKRGTGLRHVPRDTPLAGLCMKWFDHPPGDQGNAKPVSEGRTLSILVNEGGAFEIDFCRVADFSRDVRTVYLGHPGDFALWGSGLFHRWRCVRRATVATVRWGTVEGNAA